MTPRSSLKTETKRYIREITIYKPFIRPHLDYDDMIYDQTFNMSFQQKMENGMETFRNNRPNKRFP